jgi:hypothetical protein
MVLKASGAHLWIWKARYEVLRAEFACLRRERDAADLGYPLGGPRNWEVH